MQAQKQTAMRHHEVAIRNCSDSRQVTKTVPAPRVLSSRLVDKGGFPGCPRTHVAHTRTIDHMRICAQETMFFVSTLAKKVLLNPRRVQSELDIWKLYHLLHYFQQCGGKEVRVPRPKDVSFAKQYRAVYSAVTEQVRACARDPKRVGRTGRSLSVWHIRSHYTTRVTSSVIRSIFVQ